MLQINAYKADNSQKYVRYKITMLPQNLKDVKFRLPSIV